MNKKMIWTIVLAVAAAAGLAMAQEQEVPVQVAAPAASVTVEEAVMCTGVVDRVPQGVPQAAAPAETPAETPADPTAAAQPPVAAQTPAAEPVAAAEPAFAIGKVYCFTKVTTTAPTTIKHVWYFGGTAVHTMELAIGGSPWRTWSNKTVAPGMTGSWKVEIQDASGAVLKTLTFSVN